MGCILPIVSVTFGNANYRKKFDAFRIVDAMGHEPLKKAIQCALEMRDAAKTVAEALESADLKPETRAQLTLALARMKPDEFHAWIKVAEFIYAKPRTLEVSGVNDAPLVFNIVPALPNGNRDATPSAEHTGD